MGSGTTSDKIRIHFTLKIQRKLYAANGSLRSGLQLILTGFKFVIISFRPYFMKNIFNPAKGLIPGFRQILIQSFLMTVSFQGMGQSEFGYRWVKKIQENQYYLNEILSLKKLDNSLFSAGPTNIHQFNSEGAIVRSIPVPNRFMAGYSDYTELEFYRIRSGNFFLHLNYGYIPFCGFSGMGNGTAEGFIKPDTGRLLSQYTHFYSDPFWGEPGYMYGTRSFSIVTSNAKLFTHHPPFYYYFDPNLSLSHRFQLSDTVGNLYWKKTILSQEELEPKFLESSDNRFLIAFHSSDTIVSDSATQHIIPIHSKSFVELYYDSNGTLSETRIIPDSYNYTNITFKQEYYQPDGSLYQTLNEPNNPGNTTTLRFIDKTGQQKWIRKFHNTVSLRISKDDSSNVLCHRYGADQMQDHFQLEVLNRNGQTVWADTNGSQKFFIYPNVCTNLGVMNWAIQFHTISDLHIGNFHSANPSPSEYREYLLNIRETEELSVHTTDQFCTSDTAEIALLNLPGVDSLWHDSIQVQLSDSAGNFTSPTILAYSTGASIRIPFPSSLPQGKNYRLRLFAPTLNKYGPESGAIQILSDPPKPIITSSTGFTALCDSKPIQLQLPPSNATYYWSDGTVGNSTMVTYSKSISVEARIGGCRANSDTIQILNVPGHATFHFSNNICGNVNSVPLTTEPGTGRWTGPHVDSTGLNFIPSGPSDTVVIHFSDHTHPHCLIDTFRTISLTALPVLQQLGNAGFCQSNRKIALPNRDLPMTKWYSLPSFSEFTDSVSLAVPGTFQFLCRTGIGICNTSIQTNITVIPLDQSPCRPSDTAAYGDAVLQNLNCVPAQYFSRIMLDSGAFAQTPPNRFELWLSDSSGSFGQATKIGEGYQAVIEVKFPAQLKESSLYKVQIRIVQGGTIFESPGQPVQVFRTPPKPTIQILGDEMYCVGNENFSSQFTTTNSNHYSTLWMPGGFTGDTLTPQVNIPYTVQYLANGCVSPISQGLRILYSTPPVCNLVNNPNVCTPYSVVLLRTNQGTGLWTGPNVDSLTSKFYPVDADDTIAIRYRKSFSSSTCPIDTIFQFITRHRPTLPPFDTLRLCENMVPVPLPSTPWTTTWAGAQVSNGLFNPAQIPGVYTAIATTTNGFCQATSNLKIQVKDSLDPLCVTGIGTVFVNDGFRLYPNPNNGSFVLESENTLNSDKLRILNAIGQQINHVQIQSLSERSLKISELPAGLYVVEAMGNRWTVAVQ